MVKAKYPQQDLADRLRAALDSAGVSQAELARRCGVTEQSVHGWVTNGRIGKHHLPQISALTGKGLEYFLVGLKTWRRAAAIVVFTLTLPPAFDALRGMACVLCKIASRYLTYFLRHRAVIHTSAWNTTAGELSRTAIA